MQNGPRPPGPTGPGDPNELRPVRIYANGWIIQKSAEDSVKRTYEWKLDGLYRRDGAVRGNAIFILTRTTV